MSGYIDFDDEPTYAKQGTAEWFQERCGCISASGMADMMAKGKGVTREKYLYELAVERLTGQPIPEGYTSAAMQKGKDREQEARDCYELRYGKDIVQVGFIRHPSIKNLGASPDGLVGDDGLIEIKRRDLHIHFGFRFSDKTPRPAMLQMQAQLSCTGRQWADYASYNETLPPRLRLFVLRVERNEEMIAMLENAAVLFDQEVDGLVGRLEKL